MRILFVKSIINSHNYIDPHTYGFDFGIASISSVLKQHKHTTDLFIVRNWSNLTQLFYRIKHTNPDVIAYSVYGSGFLGTVRISKNVRKHFPKILQVMGGIHLILNPQDIEEAPDVDAICTGEGEYCFVDFLARYKRGDDSHLTADGFWVRKKKKIIRNKKVPFINNLNDLPFPDRDIFSYQGMSPNFDQNKVVLDYLFTRGCPFNCTYCSNHALRTQFGQSHYVRNLTPKRAIEWIKHDLNKYACERITIHDDTFTVDKKWVLSFLNLYKEIKVPFRCNLRVGTFDKNLLTKMKLSGCSSVCVGIESGDEELRLNVMKRNMKNDLIIRTFEEAKKLKLERLAFVMLGLPEETPNKFINTVKLFADIAPETYLLSIFYPYKGTELYEYVKKKKYIKYNQKWDFVERKDTILEMPQFSRPDILHYYRNFDGLVHYWQKTDHILSKARKKIKFRLLATPPSSWWFTGTQLILGLDEIILFSLRTLKSKIKYSIFPEKNN